MCADLAEFDEMALKSPGPTVAITTHHSLEAGVARVLLSRWAPDAKNRVIFTQRASPGTLAARLQTATVRPLAMAIDVPVRKVRGDGGGGVIRSGGALTQACL